MPLLKRRKGESRQQQAVRTEISDYAQHPKKFPGGKKQAIAIGLNMARKGINYMSFYDIIKGRDKDTNKEAKRKWMLTEEGKPAREAKAAERQKTANERRKIKAESNKYWNHAFQIQKRGAEAVKRERQAKEAGRVSATQAAGRHTPTTKYLEERGQNPRMFGSDKAYEDFKGKYAANIKRRSRGTEQEPADTGSSSKILDLGMDEASEKLKAARKKPKTKPVSPLFGKSLKDSYSLDQQWKANRKRKEKAIRNAPMHASKPVSTEVREERKKRTTDRGVAAIAAGREDSLPAQFAANPTQARGKPFQPARALGYPQVNTSGDEQLNRREANAKRLEKFGKSLYDAINLLRKSGRANKLFAKSFYDLVKGRRKSGEGEAPRPHTNAVLDRKINQLEDRAADILSGRQHPRGRYGYTATQALERDKKRVADANKKFADRGIMFNDKPITFKVRGLAEKEKRAAEERREKAFDRMMSKPDETEHRQRNYEKMKGKPFPGKLRD